MILCQCADASIIGCFALLREEAARNPLVVVAVMRNALTAFPMAGAGIGTRAWAGVITAQVIHLLFLAYQFNGDWASDLAELLIGKNCLLQHVIRKAVGEKNIAKPHRSGNQHQARRNFIRLCRARGKRALYLR